MVGNPLKRVRQRRWRPLMRRSWPARPRRWPPERSFAGCARAGCCGPSKPGRRRGTGRGFRHMLRRSASQSASGTTAAVAGCWCTGETAPTACCGTASLKPTSDGRRCGGGCHSSCCTGGTAPTACCGTPTRCGGGRRWRGGGLSPTETGERRTCASARHESGWLGDP